MVAVALTNVIQTTRDSATRNPANQAHWEPSLQLEEVEAAPISPATTLLRAAVPEVVEVCTRASVQPVLLDRVTPVVTLILIVISPLVVVVEPVALGVMLQDALVVTVVPDLPPTLRGLLSHTPGVEQVRETLLTEL
jgi:hypothetical protein